VTPDHVNPEAPWPELDALNAATEARGLRLAARLPVYPSHLGERWLAPAIRSRALALSDASGLARRDAWHAGEATDPPAEFASWWSGSGRPRPTVKATPPVADALRAAGRAVRVGRAMYAHPAALAEVRARVEHVIAAEGSITLARLRDELQTSRKFAQALLEYLDAERVTKRLPDDSRVLRRAPSGAAP
jgi:hypothetical protein